MNAIIIDKDKVTVDFFKTVIEKPGNIKIVECFFTVDEADVYLKNNVVDIIFSSLFTYSVPIEKFEEIKSNYPNTEIVINSFKDKKIIRDEIKKRGFHFFSKTSIEELEKLIFSLALEMNTRNIEGENQVNCKGYFNCNWFSFDALIRKQKEIYQFIQDLERDNKETKEMVEWYDVTEYMRVKLLSL